MATMYNGLPLRVQCGRGVTRMARVDFQRWSQRRASKLVRTASSEGRKDRSWWRTSSGSALMRSSPSPTMAALSRSVLASRDPTAAEEKASAVIDWI
jgi:hypothetical protein